MALNDLSRHGYDEGGPSPIKRFATWRLARKETILKQEIEAYYVSDIDNSAFIRMGKRSHTIAQSLDLPDCLCDGLTFKQRLVKTERGDCLLLARWKPERHMRRNAPDWSQKWFIEKQLFPPDHEKLFSRLEKRFQDQAQAEAEAATPPIPVAYTNGEMDEDGEGVEAGVTESAETSEVDGDSESE